MIYILIYTFYEQVIMSVKFILLGTFAGIMIDTSYELNFKRKIPNIIVQLVFWIIMTYVICQAVIVISNGYIPVYTFMYFIIGYAIYYYFLKKSYCLLLRNIKKFYYRNYQRATAIIFPKQVTKLMLRLMKYIYNKIKKFFKSIFKRKKKQEENSQNEGDSLLQSIDEHNYVEVSEII